MELSNNETSMGEGIEVLVTPHPTDTLLLLYICIPGHQREVREVEDDGVFEFTVP